MRNWLIKLLGGAVKWEGAIDPIHIHLDFDEEKAKRLIDYAISGIFIKMQPPRQLFRTANPENQTMEQLKIKLIANMNKAAKKNKRKNKKP